MLVSNHGDVWTAGVIRAWNVGDISWQTSGRTDWFLYRFPSILQINCRFNFSRDVSIDFFGFPPELLFSILKDFFKVVKENTQEFFHVKDIFRALLEKSLKKIWKYSYYKSFSDFWFSEIPDKFFRGSQEVWIKFCSIFWRRTLKNNERNPWRNIRKNDQNNGCSVC